MSFSRQQQALPLWFQNLPILKTITPLPLHSVMCVLVFIPELYCNLVVVKCEQLLPKLVALLLFPLLGQELDDGLGARQEAISVPPRRLPRISLGHALWIPRPSQLGYIAYLNPGRSTACSTGPVLSSLWQLPILV